MKRFPCIVTLATLLVLPGCDDNKEQPSRPDLKAAADGGESKPAPEAKTEVAKGRVFFVSPADGAKVPARFEVEFGVEGKQLRPAGETARDPAFGHHHVLIDAGPLADMEVVPKDETHLHFGDGATKATLELPPGKHQLTMQFADDAHRSYGPDWAATITVEVEGAAEADGAEAEAEAKVDG